MDLSYGKALMSNNPVNIIVDPINRLLSMVSLSTNTPNNIPNTKATSRAGAM